MIGEGSGQDISFELRTVALVAICLNVMPLNFFRKTYRNQSLRGVATGTMILAMAWFFTSGETFLDSLRVKGWSASDELVSHFSLLLVLSRGMTLCP